ncbi:MAG: carbohydrate-binding domain-containing protein [Treponema sp.]|nr:carbohydrate-binding domain-containing protein [Treponema sp.]
MVFRRFVIGFPLSILLLFIFASCVRYNEDTKVKIDYESARQSYSQDFSIEPMDSSVTVEKKQITFAPAQENVTYTISGYFNGQIVNKTKNTILKLSNAYLENTDGVSAIKTNSKLEVSSVNGTTNYIVSSGRNFSKVAALQGKKNLVLGGSGRLYIIGNVCHGVEADDVKMKGSGTFYIQGKKIGSALTCESFTVEEDKSFDCYLINSKNGLKADGFINIASGNFYLYDNEVALKTNKNREPGDKHHSIRLSGGNFYTHANKVLYITEKNEYHAEGAKIIAED